MSVSQALEMAQCTKINIENMVKMMPTLKGHPLLPLVRVQIDEVIKELESEEAK